MKKLFALIAFLWAMQGLLAQAPRLYSTSEGLVCTRIEHILFDKDDFLWIATDQGLCRFDGQSFSTYPVETGNPYALQESLVTSIYEDPNGQHWLGTGNGLYYLCRTENKLTRYVMDSTLTWMCVSGICPHPARENALIIATYGFGVHVFDTQTRTFDKPSTDRLQIQLHRWNCQHILTDNHKRLWIQSPNSIQCFDMEKLENIVLEDLAHVKQKMVAHAMVEDRRHDRMYLATLDGLVCCDLKTLKFRPMDIPELNGRNLTALELSPEGDLLVGTECDGLWRIHQGHIARVVVNDCPVNLDHSKIHQIAFDNQHNLWLGLYQKGLLMLPNQERLFTCRPIRTQEGLHNLGNVSSLTTMSDGSRLYGIDGSGLVHEKVDGSIANLTSENSLLKNNAVMSVAAMSNNTAYVGTYNYGVYLYDGHSLRRDPRLALLDKQSIMSMVNDSLTKTLYIGTNGDGIYAYQTETQLLTRLSGEQNLLWIVSLSLDRRHRLWASTEGKIYCFDRDPDNRLIPKFNQTTRCYGCTEDANGTMWFATNRGLLSYGAGSDSLQLISVNGEPLDQEFYSISRSRDGKLWLPANEGLVCYDPQLKAVYRYDDRAIKDVGSFSRRAATIWPNGCHSFGGDNGVLEFWPETVLAFRHPLRPIHFTRLWVNNVPTDYDPTLSAQENVLDKSLWKASCLHLGPNENNISLSFAAQDYCNPLNIRYSYHLEGYDKSWHEVLGQDKTASYSALRWGKYTLHVRATIVEGNGESQSVEKSLKIIIDAPWYASWWAIIIYVALAFVLIIAITIQIRVRAHQRHIMRRAEHNRQIKEAKLRMFTMVSHEIKTPLTLILSPLRRLMERSNDNATQSIYEMMYRSSLRILMLITQQMDIRRIDNGQMKLHVKEVPLRSFLDDIMQFFSNSALSRQIDFRLIIPDEKNELTLWCDPDQLDKVFFNLLDNAFKYVNDMGQVHIRVVPDEKLQCTRIEVFNSGTRMKTVTAETLFERFGKDGSESLGLSLANELTSMHHGTLSALNEEEGFVFRVSLPMGSNHFSEEEKRPVESSEPTEQQQLELEARAMREDSKPATDGKELIEMLSEELHEKQRLRERRARLNFNFADKQLTSGDERLLNRVSECISKNMSDPEFSVDDLASQVGISRVHLNRKLKELIDTSPSSLIKDTRLKQAAFLLAQNNVTIAEVAYSVGFTSPAYFSSNFSAYFKMTPKEFVNAYTEDADNPELKRLLE